MEIIKKLLKYTIKLSLTFGISLFLTKQIYFLIFPEFNKTKKLQSKAKDILEALGINNPPDLTENESILLLSFISINDKTTFKDIIGYENIKLIIKRRVIYPLFVSCKSTNKLLNPPTGVLFYGSPGNGKTKFVQALRLESGCRFLNIDMAKMMNKYFGESQKLINALFSLAKKLEPVILFIDQIESFLKNKNTIDNESMIAFKGHFLTKWDEQIQINSKIIIVGSSNMPKLIDHAVLRRMSVKILIDFPDEETRIGILKNLLPFICTKTEVENDIKTKSRNLSCADLIEICRIAVSNKISSKLMNNLDYFNKDNVHSFNCAELVTNTDFIFALNKFLNEKI